MPDLPSVTNFINSPPGQLVAGGVLAGIVWKFFERVEAVLTDQAKFEIAVWLVGVKVGEKVEPWPNTFIIMFDRVFGNNPWSWKFFARSCAASYGIVTIGALLFWLPNLIAGSAVSPSIDRWLFTYIVVSGVIGNVLPGYLSLLKARGLLEIARKHTGVFTTIGIILLDGFCSNVIGFLASIFELCLLFGYRAVESRGGGSFLENMAVLPQMIMYSFYDSIFSIDALLDNVGTVGPTLFTFIWLWLYAGSGFLLKFARRFDLGFDWFNRKFDIEKKPLSAIGLVAGSLIALTYWGVVVGSWLVHHV